MNGSSQKTMHEGSASRVGKHFLQSHKQRRLWGRGGRTLSKRQRLPMKQTRTEILHRFSCQPKNKLEQANLCSYSDSPIPFLYQTRVSAAFSLRLPLQPRILQSLPSSARPNPASRPRPQRHRALSLRRILHRIHTVLLRSQLSHALVGAFQLRYYISNILEFTACANLLRRL